MHALHALDLVRTRRASVRRLLAPARLRESFAVASPPSLRNAAVAGAQTSLAVLIAVAATHLSPWAHMEGVPALGALAAAVGLDGSSLVRLLDILVEQALIERRPHAVDRRVKLVHLTPAGRRTVASIRKRLHAIESELLADVDAQDAQVVLRVFERIEARIAAMN